MAADAAASESSQRELNQFLINKLEPISKADPALLANYVSALLRHDKPLNELKQFCLDQLQAFLESYTEDFVDSVFTAIESGVIVIPEGDPSEYEDAKLDEKHSDASLNGTNGDQVNNSRTMSDNLQDYNRETGKFEGTGDFDEEDTSYGMSPQENIDLNNDDDLLLDPDMDKEFIEVDDADTIPESERYEVYLEEDENPNEQPESNPLSLRDRDSVKEEEEEESSDDDDRNHKHKRRISERKTLEEVMEESKAAKGPRSESFDGKFRRRNYSDENGGFRGKSWNNSDSRRKDSYRSRDFPSRMSKRDQWENLSRGLPDAHNLKMPGRFPIDPLNPSPNLPFRGLPFRSDPMLNGPNNFNLLPQGAGMADVWNAGYPGRLPYPEASDLQRMMPLPGSMPNLLSGLFPGMIPNRPGVGLIPGATNRMMPLRMNMGNVGIHRPRCPDFEQRGFCLRGDLCPMDHGANRIVMDDIKSFQQFNIPLTSKNNPSQIAAPGKSDTLQPKPLGQNNNSQDSVATLEPRVKAEAFITSHGDKETRVSNNQAKEDDFYDPTNPYINPSAFVSRSATAGGHIMAQKNKSENGDNKAQLQNNPPLSGTATDKSHGTSVWNRISTESTPSVREAVGSKTSNPLTRGSVKTIKDTGVVKVSDSYSPKNEIKNEGSEVESFPINPEAKSLVNGTNPPHSSKLFLPTQPKSMKWSLSNKQSLESELRTSNHNAVLDQTTKAESLETGFEKTSTEFSRKWTYEPNAVNGMPPPATSSKVVPTAVKGESGSTSSTPGGQPESAALKQKETLEMLREIQRKKENLLKLQIEQQKQILEKLKVQKKQSPSHPVALKPQGRLISTDNDASDSVSKRQQKDDLSSSISAEGNSTSPTTKVETPSPAQNHDVNMQWGFRSKYSGTLNRPTRFKIDNRSTTLKVVSPFPPGVDDKEVVFNHFSMFGEVTSMDYEYKNDELLDPEVEKNKKQKFDVNHMKNGLEPASAVNENDQEQNESNEKAKELSCIRVTYSVRSGAERAFNAASWFHGKKLCIAWDSKPPAKSESPLFHKSSGQTKFQDRRFENFAYDGTVVPQKWIRTEEKEKEDGVKENEE